MEDWALIRRLAAEGVPKARIAERLGISRTTVTKAVNSDATHHRGNGAGFGEAFGVADREVLGKFKGSTQHQPVGPSLDAHRGTRLGSSIRVSCGAGY